MTTQNIRSIQMRVILDASNNQSFAAVIAEHLGKVRVHFDT
ncbi:MAG TPA: hypothetical protein VF290_26350 [Pyrinomonadaceae bacterium]